MHDTWPLFVYRLQDALRAIHIEHWIQAHQINEQDADLYRDYWLQFSIEEIAKHCDEIPKPEYKGFYHVWAQTKLRWNDDPAGLLRLPCLNEEILEEAAKRYSHMFRIPLFPVFSLPNTDCIWDDFGTTRLVIRGTLA